LEAGIVPPSLNFPQLDFVKPSSGFHPVTWERVNIPRQGSIQANVVEVVPKPKKRSKEPKQMLIFKEHVLLEAIINHLLKFFTRKYVSL
jgi:hypothetical protein